MRPLRLLSVATLLAAPAAAFQGSLPAIYVDFTSTSFGFGNPTPTFAGAAAHPGVWNNIDTDLLLMPTYTSGPLMDTAGAPTSVRLNLDAGGGAFIPLNIDNLDTNGEDEALMDDGYFVGGAHSITVSGLPPGTYTVITYAMAPDNASYLTSVGVLGAPEPTVDVGGDFLAGYVEGTTHALHTATVGVSGTILINLDVGMSFDSINGLQIGTAASSSPGVNYCMANPNSTGQAAEMVASGSASVASNDLVIGTVNLPPNQFGYFLVASNVGFVTNPGGSEGNLCVSGMIERLNAVPQILFSGSMGEIMLPIDNTNITLPGGGTQIAPGDTWYWQCWHRDNNPLVVSNFSNGREITFLP